MPVVVHLFLYDTRLKIEFLKGLVVHYQDLVALALRAFGGVVIAIDAQASDEICALDYLGELSVLSAQVQ